MNRKRIAVLAALLTGVLLFVFSTPAQAAAPAIGSVRVTVRTSANLRGGPGTGYPVLGIGYPGDVFVCTALPVNNFYQILLADGRVGYIHENLAAFTPLPTPAPTPVPTANLSVYYRDLYGSLLGTTQLTLPPGSRRVTPDARLVPPGYTLVWPADVVVSVSAAGVASPSFITFLYAPSGGVTVPPGPAAVTVPVYYTALDGTRLYTDYVSCPVGTSTVTANSGLVPPGYVLLSLPSATVTVSPSGTATPASVTFYYLRQATPPPATATLPVYYHSADSGALLNTEYRSLPYGTHTVYADDSKVPAGYSLSGSRSQTVSVDAAGRASPASVIFSYRRQATPPPASTTVPVYYRSADSGALLNTEYRSLPYGTHTVYADDSKVPAGYNLSGSRSQTVSVDAAGRVSPASVVFSYRENIGATVTVLYRDIYGSTLNTEYRTLSAGTHSVSARQALVPSGYTLQGAGSVTVTVSGGAASPSTVIFVYRPAVSATVTVLYKDNMGSTLNTEYRTLSAGSHTVSAKQSMVPAGYALQGAGSVTVTVSDSGTASPSTVTFVYGPPVSVSVPVIYQDQAGTVFYSDSVTVSSAAPKKVQADRSLAPAGYVLTGPSSVTVTVSPGGTATPSSVQFTFREATAAELLPRLTNFEKFRPVSGSHEVYTGPGTDYLRPANGKAAVGGGVCRVYGTVGDWALIGYGLSDGGYRIGYVRRNAVPSGISVPELSFGLVPMTVSADTILTDDPVIKPNRDPLGQLRAGTAVHVLAYTGDNDYWAYVEIPAFRDGQTVRGFVNKARLR